MPKLPPFYSNKYPVNGPSNTINSVSMDIRDSLLLKNLSPQYPQVLNKANTLVKIGEPILDTTVGTGNIGIPDYLPLQVHGIKWKNENNVIKNTFKNTDKTSADYLVQIVDKTLIKNTDYQNSYWPFGIQSYPIGPTDDVTKYGIIGKTNEANYINENLLTNLFKNQNLGFSLVDIIYKAKENYAKFPTANWPFGTKEYPTSSTDDVKNLGIVGKTKEGKFLTDNIIKNSFSNKSSTAKDSIEVDDITVEKNSDYQNSYWPSGSEYPVGPTDEVTKYGLIGKTNEANYRKDNVIKNLYLDYDKQIDMAVFIDFNIPPITKQIKGYIDEYGDLNLGSSGAIQAIDKIGSILNGQGLGFTKAGLVTNFDIRASLAGRVLGAAGIINDTKLGTIGGQQLALALANNVGFNVQQEIFNIFTGPNVDYTITIPSTTIGRIADDVSKILGFTVPRSFLGDDGSIFQTESQQISNIDRANSMLANTGSGQFKALLKNVNSNLNGISPFGGDNPSETVFRTGYAPAYKDNKGNVQVTNGNIYAYSNDGKINDLLSNTDRIIYDLNNKNDNTTSDYGFESPEDSHIGIGGNPGYEDRTFNRVGFSWITTNGGRVNTNSSGQGVLVGDKKSLMVKTQKLFESTGMKNIVTSKGDMFKVSSQIETANGGGFSKGNAVLQPHLFGNDGRVNSASDKAENTYCRSWTTLDRYDKVKKLVRHDGLGWNGQLPYRNTLQDSVLEDAGFVKIAPYTTDKPADPKHYMFSLENLAWSDNLSLLPEVEKGPGDFLSNKRGRIMWFPPYDITFSETSSVNWEASQFIGRGESVYTYNNTERAGNLSFSVIVDHPSYANGFRGTNGPDDHYINSFWAGCIDPNSRFGDLINVVERSQSVTDYISVPLKKQQVDELSVLGIMVYFPNDNYGYNTGYEDGRKTGGAPINYLVENSTGFGYGLPEGSVAQITKKDVTGITSRWPDRYNFGLNYSENGTSSETKVIPFPSNPAPYNVLYGFYDPNRTIILTKFLTQICPHCVVTITGYASIQGNPESNRKLANARAETIRDILFDDLEPYYLQFGFKPDQILKRFKIGENRERPASAGCPKQESVDDKSTPENEKSPPTDTLDCKKDRFVIVDLKYDPDLALEEGGIDKTVETKRRTITTNTKITNQYYNEQLYFKKMTENDPFIFDSFREKIKYFHPAFHSTTPEGLNSRLTFLLQCTRQGPTLETQGANNLAFGRAPICILRIGDFYNTKIVIDNVSFDFEPLVWDLNPEGIGVQPMIAKVNISFKFIGGSTLASPLQKLQNALSFNYFANTQVYDVRADYFVKNDDAKQDNNGNFIFDYSLINGKTDLSDYQTITNEQKIILEEVPELNQVATNEANITQEFGPQPVPDDYVNLTGIKVKDDLTIIPKADNLNEWHIKFKILTETTLTEPDEIATQLLERGTWFFTIKDVNSNEYYEQYVSQPDMINAVTPNSEVVNFIIPIKGKAFSTTNEKGIKDSLGKENFFISFRLSINTESSTESSYKLNVKLK